MNEGQVKLAFQTGAIQIFKKQHVVGDRRFYMCCCIDWL
jgi:hypothetical protein